MTTQDKKVGTIAGPFDRARAESLRQTLKDAESEGIETTMWEGVELDTKFGTYLLEFVDQQFASRGHNGL